jgi:hypothetical protein
MNVRESEREADEKVKAANAIEMETEMEKKEQKE